MATTEVTKGNGSTARRTPDVLAAMRDEMDRVFERFEQGWPRWPSLFQRGREREQMMPALDVRENGKQVVIEADLPGVDEKDVSVALANGLLTIKGEKKSQREEKDEKCYLSERSYGSFERVLQLPDGIDENKIEAKFDKGVLRVVAQKRPDAIKAEKRIPIGKA